MNAETRNYSKFFTYPETAMYMAKLLNAKPGDKILEPSAGSGNLIRAVKEYSGDGVLFYACELQEQHAEVLEKITHWYVIADWLSDEISEDWMCFDGCIANPPFGNGVDLQAHFDKICAMVKSGGKIVMIVPAEFNPTYCNHFIKNVTTHPLENWSKNSDGTTTEIKILEFINGEW
jgi:predicted RNA methylase